MGSPGVGKSAMVLRYVNGFFCEDYNKTIEAEYEKLIKLKNN